MTYEERRTTVVRETEPEPTDWSWDDGFPAYDDGFAADPDDHAADDQAYPGRSSPDHGPGNGEAGERPAGGGRAPNAAGGRAPNAAGPGPMPAARVVAGRSVTAARPSRATVAARIVALAFGLLQLVIGLRIVFLVLDARAGNALVSTVLDWSRPFVAPFEGIFQSDALRAGGSVLDIAAVAAIVGWTLLELLILSIMRIQRAGEDVA